MNLKDFYRVLTGVNQLLTDHDPTGLYQNLIQRLDQIRGNPTPDLQTAINEIVSQVFERNQLVENELKRIPHSGLVIEKLEIQKYVGEGATFALRNILDTQAYVASGQINEFISEIAAIKSRLSTIISQLDAFQIDLTDGPEDTIRVSFIFDGEVEVNNTSDLMARVKKIEDIVRAFSRLTDDVQAFEKPRIISVSKSSPLIVDVGAAIGSAASNGVHLATYYAIAKGVKWALAQTEKVLDISLKFQELKRSDIMTKTMEKEFQKLQDEAVSETTAAKEAKKILAESNSTNDDTGSTQEKITDVTQALITLLDLVKKGGSVDVFLPKPNENENETDQDDLTIDIARQIRTLTIKQEQLKLPEKTASDTDEIHEDEADVPENGADSN